VVSQWQFTSNLNCLLQGDLIQSGVQHPVYIPKTMKVILKLPCPDNINNMGIPREFAAGFVFLLKALVHRAAIASWPLQ